MIAELGRHPGRKGLGPRKIRRKQMPQPDERERQPDPILGPVEHAYDLKFLPTLVNDEPAGGWYRELPDGQIEVMARAHLECVPLDDGDPETKAREVLEKLIKLYSPGLEQLDNNESTGPNKNKAKP